MSTFKRLVKKLLFPSFLFISGVGVILGTNSIRLTAAVERGSIINARFYPRVVGGIIIILSVFELYFAIRSVRSPGKTDSQEIDVPVGDEKGKTSNNRVLLTFIIATLIYQVLFFTIGFIPATFLFLLSTFYLLGNKNKIKLVVTATVITGLIYLVFEVLLNVPLPRTYLF